MKKTLLKSLALAAVGTLCLVGNSMATPILTVSASGNAGTQTVTIDDALDTTPNNGFISYMGALGDTFITFSMATSFPAIGYFNYPYMHLTAGVANGTDLVSFQLTDTFASLDSTITGWVTKFGGAQAGGAVTLNATLNGTSIANFTAFGPDQFSSFIPNNDPYIFVISGTIQATNLATTSFDANLNPVPEPATMLLFGTGLVGLAGVRRRKNSKKQVND